MFWLLVAALAAVLVFFLFKSDNTFFIWANYDEKLSLRIKIYLIGQLVRFDFLFSDGVPVKMRKPKKLPFFGRETGNKKAAGLFVMSRGILKKCSFRWSLRIKAGTGDAAQTALLAGFLSSFLRTLAIVSLSRIPRQKQRLTVLPKINSGINFSFSCMFSVKTGHIISEAASFAAKKAAEAISK